MQTNFGGVLTVAGAPVGEELGQYYLREELQEHGMGTDHANGSVMVIVATDAPLDARNLKRLGARALLGVTRTGSAASNGSGDYAIAFSTAAEVRIHPEDKALTRHVELLSNDAISPLFLATIEGGGSLQFALSRHYHYWPGAHRAGSSAREDDRDIKKAWVDSISGLVLHKSRALAGRNQIPLRRRR